MTGAVFCTYTQFGKISKNAVGVFEISEISLEIGQYLMQLRRAKTVPFLRATLYIFVLH